MWIIMLAMSQLVWHSTKGQATTKLISLPEGEAPDGTRIKTAYQCEGSDIHLSCPHDTSIQLIRANYGRFSIAICNHHGFTNWSVDCSSPSSFNVIKKMCNRLTTCIFPVNSLTFGDSCPGTSKYLEVHFSCSPNSQISTKRPPQSHFMDGDLTSLWSPNSAKLSLETVLKAVKENELHLMTSERVPITTVTVTTASSSPTSPGVTHLPDINKEPVTSTIASNSQTTKKVLDSTEPSGHLEARGDNDPAISSEISISGTDAGRENHTVKPGTQESRDVGFSARDNYSPLLSHSTTEQPGFVLEIVTYSVASLCGLLIIFLVLRYRRPITRACSCHKPSSSSAASGSTASTTDSCSSYQEANNKPGHSLRYLSSPCCHDAVNHTVKTSNIQLANANGQNNVVASSTSGSRSGSRSSQTSFTSEQEQDSEGVKSRASDYMATGRPPINQTGPNPPSGVSSPNTQSSSRLSSPNPHSSERHNSPVPHVCERLNSPVHHQSGRLTSSSPVHHQSGRLNSNSPVHHQSGRLSSSSPHPSLCNGEYNAGCGYCQQRQWYQQSSYQIQQQLIYGHNRTRPPSQGSIIGSDV